MEEKQTLEDIRNSYAKKVEELKAQQVEIKMELEHCIRMKEAYDYMIKMKGYYKDSYIDTDIAITKELKNNETKLVLNSLYGTAMFPKIERTGDEDEY